jgi:hypothetical protein
MPAGQYVQVQDERGCAIRDTFLVTQPGAIDRKLISKQTPCARASRTAASQWQQPGHDAYRLPGTAARH